MAAKDGTRRAGKGGAGADLDLPASSVALLS
jgi:hypothetical protein